MRLLHTTTLALESFIGKPVQERPPYAILSHTWKDDEFLFEEARNGIHQHLLNPRRGLQKILNACQKAREHNLHYIWVDTCCIDKSSSAELSEAINSMFKWYKESANCYVFMDDVKLQMNGNMRNFDSSRWFTRGWTLQELIAPHGLLFFDADWNYMCSRDRIASRLETITGITQSILQRTHTLIPTNLASPFRVYHPSMCPGCGHVDNVMAELNWEPISRKMVWVARRETTRPEDISYCLLGLFDINMPLLYGEGENAFWRLQEEILKKYPDQSILTWTDQPQGEIHRPYLPKTPSAFQFAVRRPRNSLIERGDIIATARGLEVDVLFGPCDLHHKEWRSFSSRRQLFMAILSCAIDQDPLPRVAIFVESLTPGSADTAYTRVHNDHLILLLPGAQPLILVRDTQGTISELKDMAVHYDPRELSPSRILLAAIRPAKYLVRQRPGVYILAPGIENDKINYRQFETGGDAMISYKQPPWSSQNNHVSSLSLLEAWYVSNGNSGFFVLWGIPLSSADGDFISWVETWRSFLDGDLLGNDTRHLPWSNFNQALRRYLRNRRTGATVLETELSEPGLRVKVNVKTVEFLRRKTYKIVLDIDGWGDRQLSIVNCLQLVTRDWT